jgi:hypothetical protein
VQPTADADRFAVRELVENWALWRDAGEWDRFASVWHPGEQRDDGRPAAAP